MQALDLTEVIRQIRQQGYEHWLVQQLTYAFFEARKGKRQSQDENHFEMNWIRNLHDLSKTILHKSYRPGSSLTFIIYEPMMREIFAAPFRDRVVHHFLWNMTAGWWDQQFIDDSYSCRIGKGTLYGIRRLQSKMQQATAHGQHAYIVKLDLKGYFMSLRRVELYKLVKDGLQRQFQPVQDTYEGQRLYRTLLFLWKQVIFDDPIVRARRRGAPSDWDGLPPEKSLFCQPAGTGIVIGNLTSQLMSNIMLNQLDHYVTEDLGYEYYGRYVDDFYIIVPAERYQHFKRVDLHQIEDFLSAHGLTLHPKKRYMQQVEKGVQFLGARVYLHCLYPSDRLQKNFKRAALECAAGKRDIDSVISYLGMMHHLDARKFTKQVFDELGWTYRFY